MSQEEFVNLRKEIKTSISSILDSLNLIFESNIKLPAESKRTLFSYQHYIKAIEKEFISDNVSDEILNYADKITNRSEKLISFLHGKIAKDYLDNMIEIDTSIIEVAERLKSETISLASKIKFLPIAFFKENNTSFNKSITNDAIESLNKKIEKIGVTTEILFKNLQNATNKNEKIQLNSNKVEQKVEHLNKEIEGFDKKILDFTKIKNEEIEQIISAMKIKEIEINKLAGIISGTAIHGSYSQCAETEKKWADRTRYISFSIMLIIIALVGYSLYESTTQEFNLKTALFRMIFSIVLSIPAAYAARESAKHRVHQYYYQRLAMDLQSITPYLSSLPDDIQHKLKADMANKLFGQSQAETNISESYPINVQEILMAIIGKIQSTKEEPRHAQKDS